MLTENVTNVNGRVTDTNLSISYTFPTDFSNYLYLFIWVTCRTSKFKAFFPYAKLLDYELSGPKWRNYSQFWHVWVFFIIYNYSFILVYFFLI